MAEDGQPIRVRASYRAPSHLPIWQLMLASREPSADLGTE